MQSTIKARLALAAASMALAVTAEADPNPRPARAAKPRRRLLSTDPIGRYSTGFSGTRRYPEQSTRQALRSQRRAQGGPGLQQMKDGTWVPRSIVETA